MHLAINDLSDTVDIFGLLIRCPFGIENGDCPFKKFRHDYDLAEKFRLAERWAETPALYQRLEEHHWGCYKNRLARVNRNGKERRASLPSEGDLIGVARTTGGLQDKNRPAGQKYFQAGQNHYSHNNQLQEDEP